MAKHGSRVLWLSFSVNVGGVSENACGENGDNDCGISAKRSLPPHMVLMCILLKKGGWRSCVWLFLSSVCLLRLLVVRRDFSLIPTRKKPKTTYQKIYVTILE